MGVHIEDQKLAITTEPETFHFVFSKDVDKNLRHKTDSIIEHNDFLAKKQTEKQDQTIKNGNNFHKQGKQ